LNSAAENGFMGMGIGAAMTGLRPIVEGMNMGFLLLAFNQISNNCGMLHYTSGGQFKVLLSLLFSFSVSLGWFRFWSCFGLPSLLS
jgi:pyruvate/2-oxoglutarate/acetoin dehydrogenase E1 component